MIEKFSWRDFLIKDVFLTIILTLVCVSIIPIRIDRLKGNSMEPAYRDGEIIVYQKNLYDSLGIERGDVIIFIKESKGFSPMLKRVAGLEGDNITSSENYLSVNNDVIVDDGLFNGRTFQLEKGKYFVVGDNYDISFDSRLFGLVSRDEIVGKVIYPKR